MKSYKLLLALSLLISIVACKKDETDKACYISIGNGDFTILFNTDGSVKTIQTKDQRPDINLRYFNGGKLAEDEAIIDSVLIDSSGRLAFMKLKVIGDEKYLRPYTRRYEYDTQGQLLRTTNRYFDTTLITRFVWESGDLVLLNGLRSVPDKFSTQRHVEYSDTLSPESYSGFIHSNQIGYYFNRHLIKSDLTGSELRRYRYQLDAHDYIKRIYIQEASIDMSGTERNLRVDSVDFDYRCN